MQPKTVKRKTNDVGRVSLAHPGARLGSHTDHGAFVVAIQHVPAHRPAAAVLTADRTAAGDVSFDGPSTVVWDELAGARPGQLGRTSSGRAAQRLMAAGRSERTAHYIPRRRSESVGPGTRPGRPGLAFAGESDHRASPVRAVITSAHTKPLTTE